MNNVGTNIRKSTVEYTAEEYSHIQNTNLESAYNLTQVAAFSFEVLKLHSIETPSLGHLCQGRGLVDDGVRLWNPLD